MKPVTPGQWEELERECDSQYYLLGAVTPVRVLIDKETGFQCGAVAPDPETGQLAWRTTLLSRLDVSPEVEEISKEEFDRLCRKEDVRDAKKDDEEAQRRRQAVLSDEIVHSERKMTEAVKCMAIAWPLVIVLCLYVNFLPDLSTTITYIAAVVAMVAVFVAMGATYQLFEEWRERRSARAMLGGKDD